MDQPEENYRAPRAGYQGKGHIVYEDIRAFSFSQRLNRLRFACYSLTSALVTALVIALVLLLAAGAGVENPFGGLVMILTVAVAGVFYLVYTVSLIIRRLHDLDQSGLLALLYFFPIIGVPFVMYLDPGAQTLLLLVSLVQPLFLLYLTVGAGTNGMNRFGTPNPPNSVLVMVFGGLWWLLVVLGMLANVAMLVFSVLAPEMLPQGQMDEQAMQRQLEQMMRQFGQP